MTDGELKDAAMRAAADGTLPEKKDDELDALLHGCLRFCAFSPHTRVVDPTIAALREEISRRADNKKKADELRRHELMIQESQKIHVAVQKLGKPHWTFTPLFWVALATMVFAAIAAWPVIREWFSAVHIGGK